MKMFFAALALLAACGNSARAADCTSIADTQARLACFDKAAKAPKAAIKKPPTDEFADAKAALVRKLTDPESARYTDLFKVSTPDEGEVVCGMVNSKNRMGGYAGARGFIFHKRQNLATLMLSGGSDPDYRGENAASYCVYCANDPRGDREFSVHCPSLIKSYRSAR
ncbi:hypothetical protein [Bradyrhizobium sp. 63_E2_N1_3]|uniref:hypothetical protein n=1 Tax=Bradyrhizobium sp. 63_E2_N1_3 TaxID=3240373 RepID=UPI003F899A32